MRSRMQERAFTLIEIVIAMSILVIVMGVGYSSLQGILRTKELLDDRRESRLIANSVLKRLTRELQLAYRDATLLPPQNNQEKPYPGRTCLLGEAANNGEQALDSLTFMALEGGQYLPDGGSHSGIVQISYKVKESPDKVPENQIQTYYLVREEVPNTRPIEKAYEKIMIFPITKNLVSLRFRYYDDEEDEWTDTWGKEDKLGLPAMVKFSIEMRSPRGKVDKYTTSVALRSLRD